MFLKADRFLRVCVSILRGDLGKQMGAVKSTPIKNLSFAPSAALRTPNTYF
jgi:hypothetical protein